MTPWLIRVVTERCGEAAAAVLIAAHGGRRVSVPRRAAEGRALARTCGYEVLAVLVELRGGEKCYVPLAEKALKGPAVAELEAMLAAGLSTAAIQRRLAVSDRAVQKWRARLRVRGVRRPLQLSLFGAQPEDGAAWNQARRSTSSGSRRSANGSSAPAPSSAASSSAC